MRVSVAIPARNEEKTIVQAIACALKSVPKVAEVIVVANGCTDRTVPRVRALSRTEKRLRLIVEPVANKVNAINRALKAARGEVVVFTDADIWYDKKAIANLVKPFDSAKVGAVTARPQFYVTQQGGRSSSLRESLFDWWARLASAAYDIDRTRKADAGRLYEISGALYAVRRGVVRNIPSSARSEDAFIGKRVFDAGFRVGYARDAVVYARYPANLRDFLAQKARTRYGHLEVIQELKQDKAEEATLEPRRAAQLYQLKVLAGLVRSPVDLLFAFLYPVGEGLAWGLAALRFYGGVRQQWKPVESTKALR